MVLSQFVGDSERRWLNSTVAGICHCPLNSLLPPGRHSFPRSHSPIERGEGVSSGDRVDLGKERVLWERVTDNRTVSRR